MTNLNHKFEKLNPPAMAGLLAYSYEPGNPADAEAARSASARFMAMFGIENIASRVSQQYCENGNQACVRLLAFHDRASMARFIASERTPLQRGTP